MQKYQLHFSPDAKIKSLHGTIVNILMLLHAHDAWPRILHATERSKRAALKKSYDLACRAVVEQEMINVVNERLWPQIAIRSYWSEDEKPNDRFVIMFSSNPLSLRWMNMMSIELSDDRQLQFCSALAVFSATTEVPFIIKKFIGPPSQIEAIAAADCHWYRPAENPARFKRLIATVEK